MRMPQSAGRRRSARRALRSRGPGAARPLAPAVGAGLVLGALGGALAGLLRAPRPSGERAR